jgi:signal transduction histidine kinase
VHLFSLPQLESSRKQLEDELAQLPTGYPGILNSKFGYHSAVFPLDGFAEPRTNRWIRIGWRCTFNIQAVCLIPAYNPRTGVNRSYGFPKRFSIRLSNSESGEHQMVVDWSTQDFPDPGMSPVIFNIPQTRADVLQLNVLEGAGDARGRYFAFAEIFVMANFAGDDALRNCAQWKDTEIESSDQLDAPPYWHSMYLNDQIHSLGQPLSTEQRPGSNFSIKLPAGYVSADNPLMIDMDLGAEVQPQRVEIYSARPAAGEALSTYGYPSRYKLELASDPGFTTNVRQFNYNRTGRFPSDSLVRTFYLERIKIRYLRMTVSNLPEEDNHQYLALGEVSVRRKDHSLADIKAIQIHGLPPAMNVNVSALSDGFSNGRKIIPEWKWMQCLAQRRLLKRKLEAVNGQINRVAAARSVAAKWVSAGLIMFLVVYIFLQYRLRRRALTAQKKRIIHDLHDDVGSSIGSVNLAINRLSKDITDPEIGEEVSDLSLNIREAASSLKEIYRLQDNRSVNLAILLERMSEKARQILPDAEVALHLEGKRPLAPLSAAMKRNLRLFCKEVIHNCAKHAYADVFEMSLTGNRHEYRLIFRDNGVGFNPDCPREGLGLESLMERAETMGGAAMIASVPGEGTTIELVLPATICSPSGFRKWRKGVKRKDLR